MLEADYQSAQLFNMLFIEFVVMSVFGIGLDIVFDTVVFIFISDDVIVIASLSGKWNIMLFGVCGDTYLISTDDSTQ